MTVLSSVIGALRKAADYNRHELAPPQVILWPDEERLWVDCIQTLRANYPALWVLGDYAPDQGSGPSAWLRLQLDTHRGVDVPLIYLPGVGRGAFREAESLPAAAKHLFALQFQGQFWLQKNGRDWTPLAFLSNAEGGLGLDVAVDQGTKTAIQEVLAALLQVTVAELGGRKLEASDFRAIITTDPVRTLLQWMSDPAGCKRELQQFGSAWASFCAVCRADFGVDPEGDGVLSAVDKLTQGTGSWPVVWGRYKESPRAYAGIKVLLDNRKPLDMFQNRETYPQVNREEEEKLASDLAKLASAAPKDALEQIFVLHTAHTERASWVWAALGDSPLALAIGHLREVAERVRATGTPATWPQLAEFYMSSGWQADRSVLHALAVARTPAAFQAVASAVRAIYLAWLDKLALIAQGLAASYPNPGPATCRQLGADASTVYLFADGLRMDLAKSLEAQLLAGGLEVSLEHAWSALPSVTATAKPAWMPLAERLGGPLEGGSFQPKEIATGKALVHARFKQLLPELGIGFLPTNTFELPTQCAWTEAGAFDSYGHDQGAKLAWRVEEELASLQLRIEGLLQAGWKTVRVVTDHGWLLLPGGLPKAELPRHLTEARWGRCAAPEPGAQHGYAVTGWFWDAMEPVVLAPGIACFKAAMEYAHGGLTVQECLIPTLIVRSSASRAAIRVRILEQKWAGLRINIVFEGAEGLTIDLRTKAADGTTSVAKSTAVAKADGQRTSVLVAADDDAGKAAFVVAIDQTGQPVFKQAIVIGEN